MIADSRVSSSLNPSIFRAYDIRGIVGDSLTEETVFLLGKAIGSLVRDRGEHQVAIGRDGRSSGFVLSKALSDGLLSVGCDVLDIGVVPTPLLYYTTHIFDEHSGVMLTGSHNPAEYNGLKMVIKGSTLTEDEIKGLYERILAKHFFVGHGVRHELNVIERYIAQIQENIHLVRSLKIVVDAGNGVTGKIAPTLYREMGCEVDELFCDIDGNFPNHHPDPTQPENLQHLIAAVQEKQADLGIAFDGDGDRLGVVTNKGEIIWADRLLMLFAKSILADEPHAKIIYDVKCTTHLDSLIRANNGEPIMWKTGHAKIKKKMQETNALLGGEMSGHFFFKDRWYGFDDAIYAGARFLEIIAQQHDDCDTVFKGIPNSVNTPELKLPVADEEKFELMQMLIDKANFDTAKDVISIDGLRVNFNQGWGLVRPSNTTPYLILRFEAINETILQEIQSIFRTWLLSVRPDLVLPF